MGEKMRQWLVMTKDPHIRHEVNLNIRIASVLMYNIFENICVEFNITAPQYNVLRILLGAFPGGYPRCDIAARMIEKASDITRIIDRLEKHGLVFRDRTGNDRRMSITKITNKGIKLMKDLEPLVDKTHKELTKDLSEEECRKLSDLLEKLYAHLI